MVLKYAHQASDHAKATVDQIKNRLAEDAATRAAMADRLKENVARDEDELKLGFAHALKHKSIMSSRKK